MAVKSIYIIMGYTHEDYKTSWNTYGAYTTLPKAIAAMEDLAIDVAKGYHWRAIDEPEEYGDMEHCFLRYSSSIVPYVKIVTAEGKHKHLYLQVSESCLRSGKDADR